MNHCDDDCELHVKEECVFLLYLHAIDETLLNPFQYELYTTFLAFQIGRTCFKSAKV